MFRAFILSESDPPFVTSHKDDKGQDISGTQINMRIETDEITGYFQVPNPLADGKDPTQPTTVDDPKQPIYRSVFDGAFFEPKLLDPTAKGLLLDVCKAKALAEVAAHDENQTKKPGPTVGLPLGVPLDIDGNPILSVISADLV